MTDNEKLKNFVTQFKGARKVALIGKMAEFCMEDRRKIINFMHCKVRIPDLYKLRIEEAAGVKIFDNVQ